MQEFAPKHAIKPPGTCPSDEDLAAYIDGTLDKAESGRITEHLASCEGCYAIYMETLDFQLSSSPAEPEGVVDAEVVEFRRPGGGQPAEVAQKSGTAGGSRRPPARRLPLAALLLIGIGSGGYLTYFQLLAFPQLTTVPAAPPITSLPPVETGTSPLWLGPTHRGIDKQELKIDEASFRMGVQIVNLKASLLVHKIEAAQDVIARILGILQTQAFTDELQKDYTNLTIRLEKAKPPAFSNPAQETLLASQLLVMQNALEEADRLAKSSREVFDTASLDLGQWVEGGRLAAMARNPSFFQRPENQRFLRRLLWSDKLSLHDIKLDPDTRASLDRVSEAIFKSDLRPSDYAEIKQELEKILGHLYPET